MIQWLLRNNPDLLGDVLEERASGRSRAWLWRQVLIAVVRSIVDQGRRHPVLTLRAVALVLAAYSAALVITIFAYGFLSGYLYPTIPESRWPFIFFSVEFIPALLAGWALARTHRACIEPAIMIILVLYAALARPINASDLSINVIGFLAGLWGGVRLHERPTQKGIS
jgi:hypothetical protein